MKMPRKRVLAAVIALLVVADWTSKFWIRNNLMEGSRRVVVEEWLYFAHHFNPGIAFSWLDGLPDPVRVPLLSAAALLGIGVAGHLMWQTRDAWMRVACGLVIAGAMGNLLDRIPDGGVTDFLYVPFFPFVFNVADVAISVGAVLLAARMIFERDPDAPPSPTAAA